MPGAQAIWLVGFMASGKTTIGRLLAERLGWRFVDLDDVIEGSQGASITEIFVQRGEMEFRRLESDALTQVAREVAAGAHAVVALGGGAFVQPGIRERMTGLGVSVFLDVPLETAWERARQYRHRPLAANPKRFAELHAARREHYARADYRIPIENDDPGVAVDAILRLLGLAT